MMENKLWWKKYLYFWEKPFIKNIYFEKRKDSFLGEDTEKEYLVMEFKNGHKEDSPMFLSLEGTTEPAIRARIFQMLLMAPWSIKTNRIQKIEQQDYIKYGDGKLLK